MRACTDSLIDPARWLRGRARPLRERPEFAPAALAERDRLLAARFANTREAA